MRKVGEMGMGARGRERGWFGDGVGVGVGLCVEVGVVCCVLCVVCCYCCYR